MAKRNPKLFGQDLVGAGMKALGAVASAALNDRLIWPTLKGLVPGGGVPSQLAHAGATLGAGVVIDKVAGMVGQQKLGGQLAEGGAIMGGAEAIGSFVPGFSLSGSFPTTFPGLGRPAVTPALPPAGAGGSPAMIAAPSGSRPNSVI